ncbi:hypothetical protein KIK15_09590 [Williamsia sp. CHRR-6]|nr:hypothetical protein [Williamsia sp. CHRR-6]
MAVVVVALCAMGLLAGCGSDSSSSSASPSSSGVGVPLPKDFPAERVPVLRGTVLSAGGTAAEGWNLTVQATATVAAALDSAVKTLTDAGYTQQQKTAVGGDQVVILMGKKEGKTYTVQVGSVPGAAGGPNSVFYQVAVN